MKKGLWPKICHKIMKVYGSFFILICILCMVYIHIYCLQDIRKCSSYKGYSWIRQCTDQEELCKNQVEGKMIRNRLFQWRRQPWGSNWGSLEFFADHPCKNKRKTNASMIFVLFCWWTPVNLIMGKPEDPQFESHAGIKMAQVQVFPYVSVTIPETSSIPLPQKKKVSDWLDDLPAKSLCNDYASVVMHQGPSVFALWSVGSGFKTVKLDPVSLVNMI